MGMGRAGRGLAAQLRLSPSYAASPLRSWAQQSHLYPQAVQGDAHPKKAPLCTRQVQAGGNHLGFEGVSSGLVAYS